MMLPQIRPGNTYAVEGLEAQGVEIWLNEPSTDRSDEFIEDGSLSDLIINTLKLERAGWLFPQNDGCMKN
ncbi:hypothetical protein EJB05_05015, partial [Eragrostis curvula]